MREKPTLVACIGPTATGKTDLIAQYALDLDLEVISLDSALVYQELSIGANKPDGDLLKRCPHEMINLVSVVEHFDVSQYFFEAQKAIAGVLKRQKKPVIVGGTMMYAYVLSQGLDHQKSISAQQRDWILEKWPTKEEAYAYLISQDPAHRDLLDPANTHRVYRALEKFCFRTEEQERHEFPYHIEFIGIDYSNKEDHWQLLASRLDKMIEQGLEEEISVLYEKFGKNNLNFWNYIAYKQYKEYYEQKISRDLAKEKTLYANRRLAKHQRTWMRKLPLKDIFYVDHASPKVLEGILKDYAESINFC